MVGFVICIFFILGRLWVGRVVWVVFWVFLVGGFFFVLLIIIFFNLSGIWVGCVIFVLFICIFVMLLMGVFFDFLRLCVVFESVFVFLFVFLGRYLIVNLNNVSFVVYFCSIVFSFVVWRWFSGLLFV